MRVCAFVGDCLSQAPLCPCGAGPHDPLAQRILESPSSFVWALEMEFPSLMAFSIFGR